MRGTIPVKVKGEPPMAQKVIDVVGTSKESFAKAAENAVAEVGASGGTRNEIGRQENSRVPHHNKDLLRPRRVTNVEAAK
jgi:Dodecin